MSKSTPSTHLWSVRVPIDAWRMIEATAALHGISLAEAMVRLVRIGYATEATPPAVPVPPVDLSGIEQALAEVSGRLGALDKVALNTYRAIKNIELEGVLAAGLVGDRKVTLKSK